MQQQVVLATANNMTHSAASRRHQLHLCMQLYCLLTGKTDIFLSTISGFRLCVIALHRTLLFFNDRRIMKTHASSRYSGLRTSSLHQLISPAQSLSIRPCGACKISLLLLCETKDYFEPLTDNRKTTYKLAHRFRYSHYTLVIIQHLHLIEIESKEEQERRAFQTPKIK